MSAVKLDYAEIRHPLWRAIDYPGIEFDPEEGMTKQSFAEECDVNNIMRRFESTGVITHVNTRMPEYGDFTSPVDFQSSLNLVIEAEQMFADLPASIRDRFGNDPKQFLEFVADEKNRDEAIALGIVAKPADPPPPQEVRIVADDREPPSTPQPKGA